MFYGLVLLLIMIFVIVAFKRYSAKEKVNDNLIVENRVGVAVALKENTSYDLTNLIELARVLSLNSQEIIAKIGMCIDEPNLYLERYADELEERGIDDTIPDLAWEELVNALQEKKFAWKIDWRAGYKEARAAVDVLLEAKKFPEFDWSWSDGEMLAVYEKSPTFEILKEINERLGLNSMVLAFLDTGSDSYALTVIAKEDFARVEALAMKAGYRISTDFE